MSELWETYTLFPFTHLGLDALVWLGDLDRRYRLAAAFYDYGNMTVAKLALEELKGNPFFARNDAALEARANLRSLWVAAALLIDSDRRAFAIQGVIGLVVLIPYIGEIIYAVILTLCRLCSGRYSSCFWHLA